MDERFWEMTTEHLIMRPLGTEYARKVLRFFEENRAHLEPWEPLRSKNFYTIPYQKEFLRYELKEIRNGTGFRFWLFEKDDEGLENIVGSIALNNIAWGSFSSSFIGYRMHHAYTGRGYMTEAVDRLRTFAFDVLGLHRLEVCIIPRNIPSRRVVEKLGFEYEGTSRHYMRINGVWEDHCHYVALNEPTVVSEERL